MDPNTLNLTKGAAGAGGKEEVKYVEQVFNTFLYIGNDTVDRVVENGLDLSASGPGGLVWIKHRDSNDRNHIFTDTVRGAGKNIISNDIDIEETDTNKLKSFTSNGFTLGENDSVNGSNNQFVAWTFLRQPGFFDIVTYQGNKTPSGTEDQTIDHNLGCVPGCIMVKCLDQNENWCVYHKNMGKYEAMHLNTSDDEDGADWWNDTAPTATQFSVGAKDETNKDGKNYIAYLFADGDDSDAQIFGDNADESIIKMGAFTTDASQNAKVTGLGWEPQWVLFKCKSQNGAWRLHDSMRSMDHSGYADLRPNESDNEAGHLTVPVIGSMADGFNIQNTNASRTFIYIAIRSGLMKTPTSGSDVFAMDYGSSATVPPTWDAPFYPDAAFYANPDATNVDTYMSTRQMGPRVMQTNDEGQQGGGSDIYSWDGSQTVTAAGNGLVSGWGQDHNTLQLSWMFKKAAGFLDLVYYKGTGGAHGEPHNLGVAPELIIIKCKSHAEHWTVYHKDVGNGFYMRLNSNMDQTGSNVWNSYTPDSGYFQVGANNLVNNNGEWFQGLLFASCPGVSKVGSYIGPTIGSNVEVDCGFSAGARFVLIKRWDDDGDWYLFDTTRGISSTSNDPYHLLNNNDAQTTTANRLDANTSGFTVRPNADAESGLNTNGGEYLYLAIA